jgi:hypothetical protein
MPVNTFVMLHERLRPLAMKTMPLAKRRRENNASAAR